jgi:8-oxo-dGTP pyrophosphatase MutT (NUDIX family)
MEIVDMVNEQGQILGSLPRPFVHTWNILHRGIGMIVSQEINILDGGKPNIYVHQRTDTKRIFPSLYDMFVGGVSCRGESSQLTAAREVAEELGLRGALEYRRDESKFNPLSSELFQCTICTAYNRCVVSMFAYQCLSEESVRWQEEEVQWGEFVPYDVVEVAAALSIDRLVGGAYWPGGIPSSEGVQLNEKIDYVKKQYANDQAWETWDFVPDGLLVWEAWLKWFKSRVV